MMENDVGRGGVFATMRLLVNKATSEVGVSVITSYEVPSTYQYA